MELRRCFVLRILAGLPRDAAATLLQIDVEHVDQYTSAALPALAALQNKRTPTKTNNGFYDHVPPGAEYLCCHAGHPGY
jgi:hypothetical protein